MVDGRACHLIIALSRANGTAIELVQALDDYPDCYRAQLPDWSCHVPFVFPLEYDAVQQSLLQNGYQVALGADQKKSGEECYYYEPEDGGPVFELNNLFPEDPQCDSLDGAFAHLEAWPLHGLCITIFRFPKWVRTEQQGEFAHCGASLFLLC